MKKYKLLKELPGLEVGTIIGYVGPRTQYSNDNVRINRGMKEGIDIDWNNLNSFQKYSYKLLENIIENNHYDGWLEEIKEPKSIYNLEEGDKYFYISYENKEVFNNTIKGLYGYEIYKDKLEIGNVFLTKEEAQKELEKKKALAKIRKWIRENNVEIILKGTHGFSIMYYPSNDELSITEIYTYYIGNIIFENKEDTKKCLNECKQEWKILYDLQNKND